MPKINSTLTGVAGEHYVAYKLSCLGFVAALPRGGAMGVDILVSMPDGSRTLAIQVKTTEWAMRQRGRGTERKDHHLEFPLGHKSASLNSENLLFAFVDLRGIDWQGEDPVVYLVPAQFVQNYCSPWVDHVKMVRLHIPVELMEPFKEEWSIVARMLGNSTVD